MNCTPRLLPLLLGTTLLFAACDKDRDNGGGVIRRGDTGVVQDNDSGVPPGADTGVPPGMDSGVVDCSANPNGCVAHEVIGSAPACACLGRCEPGWIWNTGTRMCEVDGNFDAGVPDSGGGNPDGGGGNPDGGAPTACMQNAQCGAGVCVNPTITNGSFVLCNGCANGQCQTACNPFAVASGCPGVGNGCVWTGPASDVPNQGICVPAGSGGTQGQACDTMFVGGQPQGDNCNGSQNYRCVGDTEATTMGGTCLRLCRVAGDTLCSSLGNYTCQDASGGQGFGFCQTVAGVTDLGRSCTAAGMCMGNLCEPLLGNSCSITCSAAMTCPPDGICVSAGGPSFCAKTCTFGAGGDSACAALNPMTICETLGTPPNTFSICVPRCAADADCTPSTCNMATGHCN